VNEQEKEPYLETTRLSEDETTILDAFRIMDADLRDSWLLTARAKLEKHKVAAKKTAA
jgi:hypothetical protein